MASLDPVDIGSAPDDGTGDPHRTAFSKINVDLAAVNDEGVANAVALATLDTEKVDHAGAQAAASAYLVSLPGLQDATTCLQGDFTFGLKDPPQVTAPEIADGTATDIKSMSAADIVAFVVAHGGAAAAGLSLIPDANAAVTIGDALNGTHRRLTHATPALTLDAQATVGTIVAATPAGGTSASVAVEAGATHFSTAADQAGAGSTAGFNIKGFTIFECQDNADGNSGKWYVSGDTDLAETTDGNLLVAGDLEVAGAATLNGASAVNGVMTFGSSAALVGGDKVASAFEFKDIAETAHDAGTLASGAVSFDYTNGGYQYGTTGAGNITSVAITNPPATGRVGCITLEITQGATPRTIAWGAAFSFPGGTDFALTASAGAVDIFTFITRNGGTTWRGFEGGKAFAP